MDDDVKEYLLRMHQIIDLPQYNNAMVTAQHIVEAMKRFEMSLQEVEICLRIMQSRIHLIGFPLEIYGPGFISRMFEKEEPYEYALWIEMNGREALDQVMLEKNLTASDVDFTLEKTGFLMKEKL